ncbi:unnamed protein product [Nyctereutes procyonoides]|uniref:(raccoon dog) hypothetical protein n=1 Tax=Nyctereutes procyonoides TaxID=34880 RepID=A0A811ZSP5_NYCPR|nr:unnamed protein product [Nyctereutes procyonoides]
MAMFQNEVEIKDFQYDEGSEAYFYNGTSCFVIVKVIYDKNQFRCGETVPASSTHKELVTC